MVTTIAHAQWKSWNYCQRGAGDHCWHLQKTKLTPSLVLVAWSTGLSLKVYAVLQVAKQNHHQKHKTSNHVWSATIILWFCFFTYDINREVTSGLVSWLVNRSVLITWVPWLNLWSDWWFDVTAGRIPELSVAAGSVQFTCAESWPCSAYTTNELDGQVAPNVGGRISAKWTDSSLATTP